MERGGAVTEWGMGAVGQEGRHQSSVASLKPLIWI